MFLKKKTIVENKGLVEKQLRENSYLSQEAILEKYNTRLEGLNELEVEDKIDEYGENIIDIKSEDSLIKRIKEAIINPFNFVLLIVAVVTFFTDIIFAGGKPSYETFILIAITIFASATISFTQQQKSSKEAKKLQNLIVNKVDVYRNGKIEIVDIEEVVPGDIVKLSSGDMLPGDVRFLQAKDLFIDQAPLTGESNPVEKFIENKGEEDLTSLTNIGFMGTNVVSGMSTAIVLSTGNNTYFGSMAKSLYTINEKSSFEKGIDSVSRLLIRFTIIMVPIVFLINIVTNKGFLESLLFGITIAVGLTPEMLPVIITSTLAKGAVAMSKKKTIVKRLGTIQSFGEMDILCTDKTGTLTEDEIVLEKYMDTKGKEDKRILRHAFLNSYFQTGLKNLIDVAIINRAGIEGLNDLKEKYIIEDEIPFDFARRRLSVVLKDNMGKRQLITKGAVEEMLSICSFVEIEGKAIELNDDLRKEAIKVYEKHNNDGLRVIAVAQKNEIHDVDTFGVNDEKDMVLIGFIGFLDPPKESAKTAIKALKKHGVRVVVLTGDSEGVAVNVCNKVDIDVEYKLTGVDVEKMSDEELKEACEKCNLFSKLSPFQKQRIVKMYQENGHTCGYMGDGINDSPPLKQSDVGISVDTAVDIAKEMADIILLEKDLNILEEGVIGGRKTFANISKYIKMATSGNFGNMLSVILASIFLPFLPLLPIHILIQNILCDLAQLGMPFDNVDDEIIKKPKKWGTAGIKRIMVVFGILSTVLDLLCFLILWFVLGFNTPEHAVLFQTGWFVFGIISQTLIIHMIRTHKIPFIQSKPSKQLVISTIAITIITLIIGFSWIAGFFDLAILPQVYMIYLLVLMIIYIVLMQGLKRIYVKKYDEWL